MGASTAAYTGTLLAGYYSADIELISGNKVVGVSRGAALRIVEGATTNGTVLIKAVSDGGVVIIIEPVNPPVVTLTGQVASFAQGETMTVTAAVTPADTYTYQWYLDGSPLSGKTASSIQVGTGLLVGTYVLTVQVAKGEVLSSPNSPVNFSVTTPVLLPTGLSIQFKASAAPTIWLWEVAGRSILTLEGEVWPGPSMVAADIDGWYSFVIPESYLPITKDLAFKFNSGAEITLTVADKDAGKTWYDGSWKVKPAPVASAPKVSISPDGGYFDPSVSVTVTVTNDVVAGATTSATYTIEGAAPVAIVGGTATFSLTATKSLSVSATNSAGTTSKTVQFTKGAAPAVTFHWDNASVYFVLTDRFFNGNTSNDNSYGRPKVDATGKNIGTFHGGDLAGLTQKLEANYFNDLGINALWISAPYEQSHGFVAGGDAGDFGHWAYHGYYALDFSNIDANMGTKEEFKTFVKTAHSKGIRVILDIVLNHSGYPTLKDMEDFNWKPIKAGASLSWLPSSGQTWSGYHDAVLDYSGSAGEWGKWWGSWVRAGLPGYTVAGGDDLTKNLAYLPDFKTEDTTARGLPAFLANKATFGGAFSLYDAAAAKTQQKRVRDWLTEWVVQWVREYGVDGFRVDTAKHVEMDTWINLKNQSKAALTAWRVAEAAKSAGERDPAYQWSEDFWMTGEVWGHGPNQSNYHTSGAFNSVINFGFQGAVGGMLGNPGTAVSTWGSYAGNINSSTDWNSLSYISSHDTGSVFYNGSDSRQMQAGTAMMLLPGGVQVYYGDELGRVNGDGGSDKDQGSRSSIDWSKAGNSINQHWNKVGQFRRNNIAVGAGQQSALTASSGQAVARTWTNGSTSSKVAIVVGATGSTNVQVGTLWADGTQVRNAYTGVVASVTGGSVSFAPGAVDGLILIEIVK